MRVSLLTSNSDDYFPSFSLRNSCCDLFGPSVTNKFWEFSSYDSKELTDISSVTNESEIVSRILACRGINAENALGFLDPSFKLLLPDPSHLIDLDKAVHRFVSAIKNQEKILIFGDYDVDGETSIAILLKFINQIGAKAEFYVPNRDREGYGATPFGIQTVLGSKPDLILMVDNGTTAHEAFKHINGVDVIIIDHHVPDSYLPPAFAIINPHRLDETTKLKNLCAAGLVFLFVIAANRALRNWYNGIKEPDLKLLLDLVALGTVCDVTPLVGLNRAYVSKGLKVIGLRKNLGISALIENSGLKSMPTAEHLAFILGPRLNAAGRIGDAALSVRLLTTDHLEEAKLIASQLSSLNKQRQRIEEKVLSEAIAQAILQQDSSIILIFGENWAQGVLGIVAGRIKERFAKPCCVVSFNENGIGKGSGRSVRSFDLGKLIHKAKNLGFLIAGGGHAQAVGLTIEKNSVEQFKEFMFSETTGITFTEPALKLDGVLSTKAIKPELACKIGKLAPFGVGNPTPNFMIPHVYIESASVVGNGHIACTISHGDNYFLKTFAFRKAKTTLGQIILSNKSTVFHAAGTIQLDRTPYENLAKFILEDLLVVSA